MRHRNYSLLKNFFIGIVLIIANIAFATDTLPYTQRTHSYNGLDTTAMGDTRMVGMSGAAVGLGDTFLASTTNPAGLAMTMNFGDFNATHNQVSDGNIQDYQNPTGLPGSLGLALNIYPWGFSFGSSPTGAEGQAYVLPTMTANVQNEVHEFRAAVGRVFANNRLALGMSLNFGVGEEEISAPGFDDDHQATALGATWGAMVQLPERMFLGASYTLPMHYAISGTTPELPGYLQPIDVPSKLEFGFGWIPNRLLRMDAQLSIIGAIQGAALLSNDGTTVGDQTTLQPKLGFAYVYLDYLNWQGTFFVGNYFEASRIDGLNGRFHQTGSVEIKGYIFTAGIGIDTASNYQNLLFSVGVDMGEVLTRLRLVPAMNRPDPMGFFPNPFMLSDQNLARPLVANWKPQGPNMNPIKIITDFPGKVEKEVVRIKEAVVTKKKKKPKSKPKTEINSQ